MSPPLMSGDKTDELYSVIADLRAKLALKEEEASLFKMNELHALQERDDARAKLAEAERWRSEHECESAVADDLAAALRERDEGRASAEHFRLSRDAHAARAEAAEKRVAELEAERVELNRCHERDAEIGSALHDEIDKAEAALAAAQEALDAAQWVAGWADRVVMAWDTGSPAPSENEGKKLLTHFYETLDATREVKP